MLGLGNARINQLEAENRRLRAELLAQTQRGAAHHHRQPAAGERDGRVPAHPAGRRRYRRHPAGAGRAGIHPQRRRAGQDLRQLSNQERISDL